MQSKRDSNYHEYEGLHPRKRRVVKDITIPACLHNPPTNTSPDAIVPNPLLDYHPSLTMSNSHKIVVENRKSVPTNHVNITSTNSMCNVTKEVLSARVNNEVKRFQSSLTGIINEAFNVDSCSHNIPPLLDTSLADNQQFNYGKISNCCYQCARAEGEKSMEHDLDHYALRLLLAALSMNNSLKNKSS